MSATPVTVTGITAATAVTGGGFHTCALLQDGSVRCWGQNDYGQLGNGTVSSAQVSNATPVEVIGITTATAVTAGGYHACALLQNGSVRCWGQNDYGQLGDGAVITPQTRDRKSTRLNSSHSHISHAVFCLKQKTVDVGLIMLIPPLSKMAHHQRLASKLRRRLPIL